MGHAAHLLRTPQSSVRRPGIGASDLPEGPQCRLHEGARIHEARDERRLRALQKRLNTVKLLIVDELGYVPPALDGFKLDV